MSSKSVFEVVAIIVLIKVHLEKSSSKICRSSSYSNNKISSSSSRNSSSKN